MTDTIKYFTYEHLPEGKMKDTSGSISVVAEVLEEMIPEGPEKEAGMRKLLEAKDCFVRACIPG